MSGNDEPKPMDLNALRRDILGESEEVHAIIEQTEQDIIVDDFQEDREICYHLVQPTADWLAERFFWAPSIKGDTGVWSMKLAEILLQTDLNMFICLNRVIVMHDTEDDEAAVLKLFDEPDLDMPGYQEFLGLKWTYKSCVIVNLTAIESCVRELVEDVSREGDFLSYDTEMKYGFVGTLLHELRHLGLEGNPYLSEREYPQELFSEEAVEQWARAECDKCL